VFDDYHQQNMADRHQKLVDRLDQAVKDGKITEDQKNKIIAKLDELHKQFQGESKQDRHANRQQLHDALQQWAKDNGINLDQILPHGLGHGTPSSNN
jgi:polyhydroxyalkanoate synthesis regulator phasin